MHAHLGVVVIRRVAIMPNPLRCHTSLARECLDDHPPSLSTNLDYILPRSRYAGNDSPHLSFDSSWLDG